MDYIETPSGLVLPKDTARRHYQKSRRPKAVDLFCGAGGMSLGLIMAGYEVVAGVDAEAKAAMCYMTNLGAYPCKFHFVADADFEAMTKAIQGGAKTWSEIRNLESGGNGKIVKSVPVSGSGWISHAPAGTPGVGHFWLGDIRRITGVEILAALGMEIGELDLVAGGPPCQGFSAGGKRDVMDPRNSLVFEFARLVCEMKPKSIVMENVPGIVNMVTPDGVPVLDAFCRILEDGGFGGYNAFRQSMKQQGYAGLLRGGKAKQKEKQPAETVKDKEQLSLF